MRRSVQSRTRHTVSRALRALFGLVWAPPGFAYLLPISFAERSSLAKAIFESVPAGLLGALVGMLLAKLVTRMTQRGDPVAAVSGPPVTIEPLKL